MSEDPSGHDEVPVSLGTSVARGLSWSLTGQVLARVGVFLSGIVLARLLTQEDFGLYATAFVIVSLMMAVNELGVIPAIVRWQDDDLERAAGTGSTLALGSSLLLFAVALVGAPWLADVFDAPESAGVLRVLAFIVVVDGAVAVPIALITRTFRQDRMTGAEVVGMLVYGVTAVLLAVAGAGPWSFAWGRVAGALATGSLFFAWAPFVPRPGFDRTIAAEILRFGVPIALSALVAAAVLGVDYLVVGHVLGTVALGVYFLAFNLSNWPVSTLSLAVSRVSFAGFSRLLHDPARLRAGFVRTIAVAMTATVPLVVLLAALAPEVIETVYGPKWRPAVTVARYLLVLGGFRVLAQLFIEVTMVAGHPTRTLVLRIAWLVVLVPALAVGARVDGLRGVGIAHVAVAFLVVAPLLGMAVRDLGVRAGDVLAASARPLAGGAASLLVMAALTPVVAGDVTRLVVIGAAGLLAYSVAVLPANPLVGWFWARLRGRQAPDADAAPGRPVDRRIEPA